MKKSVSVTALSKFAKCEMLAVTAGKIADPEAIKAGNREHAIQEKRFKAASTSPTESKKTIWQSSLVKLLVVGAIAIAIFFLLM